jgi:Icc-related predicted phosphoesterase
MGQIHVGGTKEELEQLTEAIRWNGFYPYPAGRGELDLYRSDPAERDALFERMMVEQARRWMALGDERVARTGIPVYVMAGNDDPWSFDAVLRDARHVISAEDAIFRIGDHEMLSSSYANTTPWKSPRELPDPELYERLKALAEKLEAPERAIFNLHAPPFDSGLDLAYEVSSDLSLVTKGGRPVLKAVGSEAVRKIIEEYQPLLALHGHIHESRGVVRIGRTLCINPGSEYHTGRINGVLLALTPAKVVGHQFVVG